MIGIDIVEHSKIINSEQEFIKRVLSPKELTIYEALLAPERKTNYLASRIACKEAIFKAFKSGDKTLNYRDLSILNKPDGSPYLETDKIQELIEISISHSENYSVAIVLRK